MNEKSDIIYADLEKALQFLADTLQQPKNDYMRAAAIKAFEICFDLSWKYLQARLQEDGLSANSPKAVFREAGKSGLISEVKQWLEFIKQRNLSVHTYKSVLADEVYAMARDEFLPAAQHMLHDVSLSREI